MHIPDVLHLSFGEWSAISAGWNAAHGRSTAAAPSEAEFEAAVIAARQDRTAN